jgi:hypothetical protein
VGDRIEKKDNPTKIFRNYSFNIQRGFREGSERVRRAKALRTLSEPPIKPLPFLIRPKMEVSG